MDQFTELLVERFESLADNVLQVCKVLEKRKLRQTNIKGNKPSSKIKNIKKLGVDNMMQNIIQYVSDDGMLAIYQPKGYLSYREKERRWMGRFRQLERNEKCVYAKTKKECKEKLDLAIRNYCVNFKVQTSSNKEITKDKKITKYSTLNEWFSYWLETFKKQEIKESTYNQYVEIYNRYTFGGIGDKRVNEPDSIDLQKHINGIPAHSGKKKTYQILRDLFNLLHKLNYIKTNPMTLVVLPLKDAEDIPNDDEEANKILTYKNEMILLNCLSLGKTKNKYFYPVKLILYSGLRRGEMLGLQWKHIDFENEIIKVRQQYNIDSSKITSVKTKAAIRDVILFPQAKQVLKELYQGQSQDEFIFRNQCVGITQRLNDLAKRLEFKISPHMLRHTFASRTYYAEVDPKRIQKLLGHESMDTTLNTYTHVLEAEDREIILEMKNYYVEKGIILTLE